MSQFNETKVAVIFYAIVRAHFTYKVVIEKYKIRVVNKTFDLKRVKGYYLTQPFAQ